MFNAILECNHRIVVHSCTPDLLPSELPMVIDNVFSNKCVTLSLFIFLDKGNNIVLDSDISSGLGPSTKKINCFLLQDQSPQTQSLQKHVHFTDRNKVKILVCHVFITVDDAQARNKTA